VVTAENLCTEYWKVELMGREDEGGRCEDGTDDIKDWSNRSVASVQGLARDRQQWRLLVHEMISDQWRSQKFSMEGVRVEVL